MGVFFNYLQRNFNVTEILMSRESRRLQNGFRINETIISFLFISAYHCHSTNHLKFHLNYLCASPLLAPFNFWVDELEEISSNAVALRPISQLLVLLIFLKNY